MLRDLVLLKLKTMEVRVKMHQKVLESEERFATGNHMLHMRSATIQVQHGRMYTALNDLGRVIDGDETPSRSHEQSQVDESTRMDESTDF